MRDSLSTKNALLVRTLMSVSGVCIISFAVALARWLAWGIDPFTCFIQGLERTTGFSYGIVLAVVMGVFLIVTFLLNKQYIGLATVLTMSLQGVLVNIFERGLVLLFPNLTLPAKIAVMCVTLFVHCLGASFYITSNLGVSAYDAISLIMADKRIAAYRWCRIATDSVCALAGFLFHGNIGVLTIVLALCVGPFVSWMNEHWSQRIIQKFSAA